VGGMILGLVREATSGEPLPDVSVGAEMSTTEGFVQSSWRFGVNTDASGRYTLTAIEAGAHRVSFRGYDHAFAYYPDLALEAEAEAQLVTVALGETTMDIDANLNPLSALRGQVRDPAGEPISGIGVTARHISNSQLWYPGQTNTNGEYTIDRVPAGDYIIQFSRTELCGCYNREYYNSQGDPETPETVTVGVGDEVTGLDVVLPCGVAPAIEDDFPDPARIYLPFATR
jgi:hypothetical protein